MDCEDRRRSTSIAVTAKSPTSVRGLTNPFSLRLVGVTCPMMSQAWNDIAPLGTGRPGGR